MHSEEVEAHLLLKTQKMILIGFFLGFAVATVVYALLD